MTWRLTKAANADLVRILRESKKLFGAVRAAAYGREFRAAFDFLAEHPRAARERRDLSPPVRLHPVRSHVIVYVVDESDDVAVVRIRHAREDWIVNPV
ncbi:type II toxin-antitoxin system RelE/ParE family toxin [Salinarimonas ramus]|uniref:Plasmid stabilization protein ParE n=1 Tax=Salinarimonas ramus TaxID=690164 RepID=A0A917V536_9HYPH|nr:type II toxin-antitoxin system RelE/ParE family toxin [Salinarimonas ramus]GGK41040.1 plasmid stabilization protein ParE [Salinarimonas ramus]